MEGERGPNRFGVRMWEGILGGDPAGEAAREFVPDIVGESGYDDFEWWEKGFVRPAAAGSCSWFGK
jgi:hypothetical protein